MSDFVEAGIAKIREAFAEVGNAHPVDVARAVLEHVEAWAGGGLKAPAAQPVTEDPKEE